MRLINIEDLKGCAIVRPHTHEDIMAIESCSEKIAHKDIPTAFDINSVIKEQCIATVKVDFSKEDVEKLVEQKIKESIDINIDGLKNLLMVYFNIKKHGDCRYGMIYHENFYEFDENDVDDIIKFIKENK